MGVDINPDAVMVSRNRLDFSYAPLEIKTYVGDARSLDLIEPESILREDIIKMQWKMKSTRERTTKFKESMKWW